MENTTNDLSESEREAFKTVGRIGGKASFKKNGREHMRKIGKKGSDARWKSKKKK